MDLFIHCLFSTMQHKMLRPGLFFCSVIDYVTVMDNLLGMTIGNEIAMQEDSNTLCLHHVVPELFHEILFNCPLLHLYCIHIETVL